MTKMHFEAFARTIRESDRCEAEKTAAAHVIMRVAAEFNPRFDRERFWRACGLSASS